ncbi:MAG: hypothetical protein NTY12_03720 [Candidatus Falkowbacteria bacterium]|nr:hypothetical protein [Candidatus Falkowbacteria bacterium]
MLGKPSWFMRRKYTGWGFTPRTWQGWVYILVMILPFILITKLGDFGKLGLTFMIIWALIFAFDFIHILLNLKMDEREKIHEAISERNALWIIILVLIAGLGYQTAIGVAAQNTLTADPVILAALVAGTIAKIISNIYLDRKD